MIYFFADDHYDAHSGKVMFEHFPAELQKKVTFAENDWSILENGDWPKDCELLILHIVGETCNMPHANGEAEKRVLEYCRKGGNLLLLHGSSAAFWRWAWWRNFCGLRWVRANDPDGVVPSLHITEAYRLELAKTRHPLAKRLHEFALPKDEIYTALEQTRPLEILMNTHLGGNTWPQLVECISEFGGKVVSFLPCHAPEVAANGDFLQTVYTLIDYLLQK